MPLLLLFPLLVLALFSLWALLLPFSMWARYASGKARRRAHGWVVRINTWMLTASLPIFMLSAWIGARWMPDAVRDAGVGLLVGCLLGILSLWLTRFEHDNGGFHYTPNRWLVLGLTLLVAARLGAGLWLTWRHLAASGADPAAAWLQARGWMGVAGVLFGYYLAYGWGLRARLPKRSAQLKP